MGRQRRKRTNARQRGPVTQPLVYTDCDEASGVTDVCSRPEKGPRLAGTSWCPPPNGLFDCIVSNLSARSFVVCQLVCRSWRSQVCQSLRQCGPKRPEAGSQLRRIAAMFPNVTRVG